MEKNIRNLLWGIYRGVEYDYFKEKAEVIQMVQQVHHRLIRYYLVPQQYQIVKLFVNPFIEDEIPDGSKWKDNKLIGHKYHGDITKTL